MVHVNQRLLYLIPVAAFATLLVLLNITAPDSPAVIFLVFACMYLFYLGSFFVLLRAGTVAIGKIVPRSRRVMGRLGEIGTSKAYYVASVLAFAPVAVTAMQSLGQLQVRDVLLLAVFEVIAVFYLIKRR